MLTLDAVSTAYASITTSWDAITTVTWTKLRLVRSATGTPRDERDGNVLFEDNFATARTSYTDAGLTVSQYYYYGLFVLTTTGWLRVADATFLVTKDWGYTGKLYSSLPEVFRSPDYATVTDAPVEPEASFLYRFLSVFGFQLDGLRSEAESVRHLVDAKLANQALLPALAAQVGVPYEPEIGTRSLRQLIANAIHLWGIKGTVPGVRELASVLTGYVTHVRIGRNLMLDGLDAGPTTDIGRWSGITNCTVTYRANAITDTNPAGDGVRIFTATAAGAIAAKARRSGIDNLGRMQQAIPVLPNTDYMFSQYTRTPGAAATVATTVTWVDAAGAVIGADVAGASVALAAGWGRSSLHAVSPATARYAVIGLTTSALAVNQTVEHCGVQVEEGTAVTAWQCAREVQIYFDPQVINYVGNTSGEAPSNYGWSTGVEAAVDPTYGPYLVRYTPDPEDPSVIWYLDALEVVYPGDAVPPPPAPIDSLAPTEVYYTAAHEPVVTGQTWTALAEAIPPASDAPTVQRYGRVGFRLYDSAGNLVGNDMSVGVLLVQGQFTPLVHELDIPAGAAYDHIEVSIITDGPCGFRHVALEPVNQYAAFFFDGSAPSTTGDYLWTGTPFQSPSYSYDRRSSRTVRLRALLLDFLPHGSCYDIFFATAVPAASPQSISGVDADPATSLPL